MDGKGLAAIRLRDLVVTTLAAIVVAVLVKTFVLGTFTIPSHSMEHTLLPGDNILVSKLPALFGGIERGDVIVFSLPDTIQSAHQQLAYIKRVIGLAGDTLMITPDGISVNNRLIPNPPESAHAQPTNGAILQLVVPDSSVYVVGDNRANSWDSRYWGPLPTSHIIGKPLLIYWSRGATTTDTVERVRWNRFFRSVQ